MKYRDVITVFLTIFLILSVAFAAEVDTKFWPLPVIVFAVWGFFMYKLWIEKD